MNQNKLVKSWLQEHFFLLGPIKTKVGYFAIKEVNLGTFISEKINAFFQK